MRLSRVYSNNNKKLTPILVPILIGAITVDMIVSSFLDILAPYLSATINIVLFISIVIIIYSLGQKLLITSLISRQTKSIEHRKPDYYYYDRTAKIIRIILYAVSAILTLIILQMITLSYFNTILLIAATLVSFVPASIVLGILSYNLLIWYKTNRSTAVLLYALSTGMVCTALGLNAVIYSGLLLQKPSIITAESQFEVHFSEISASTSGLAGALYFVGWIPFLLAFILIWAGTAFLMRHYSDRIGQLKFWTIISLPLAAYLIAIIPTMLLISQNRFVFDDPSLLHFRILFKTAVIAGAVFFGLIFFIIARIIKQTIKTKNNNNSVVAYVIMAGCGITMTTILLASPVYHSTYPPFGVASSSFIAFTSYLVSIGFYYSAVSISTDAKLRREIKKITAHEVQLLGNIASAQMENEIKAKVFDIARRQQQELTEQQTVSIQSSSIDEDEIRDYVNRAIKETRGRGDARNGSNSSNIF